MIGISTRIFDINGHVLFKLVDAADENDGVVRRVSSVATLDGNSYVSDRGYSPTDTLMYLRITKQSNEVITNVLRIAKYHSEIFISTERGCFVGIISQVYYTKGVLTMSIVIVREA